MVGTSAPLTRSPRTPQKSVLMLVSYTSPVFTPTWYTETTTCAHHPKFECAYQRGMNRGRKGAEQPEGLRGTHPDESIHRPGLDEQDEDAPDVRGHRPAREVLS